MVHLVFRWSTVPTLLATHVYTRNNFPTEVATYVNRRNRFPTYVATNVKILCFDKNELIVHGILTF